MPIYHYHATKQAGYSIVQIDGIAVLEKPIIDMEGYIRLKILIAENQEIGGTEGITVCSLSLLQE